MDTINKPALKKRVLTAIILFFYFVIVIAFSILATPEKLSVSVSITGNIGKTIHFVYYLLFFIFTFIIGFFGIKEINKLFFNNNNVTFIFLVINLFLGTIVPLIPAIINIYYDVSISSGMKWELLLLILVIVAGLITFVTTIIMILSIKKWGWKNLLINLFLQYCLAIFIISLSIILMTKSWTTLVYIILIPIFADIFAYFGGSLFGKHKFAPSVSPNKSWEGVIISFVFTLAIMMLILYGYYASNNNSFQIIVTDKIKQDWLIWIIIVFIVMVLFAFSVLGDLLFSKIKRSYNLKDFSDVLPGHGGIFDRIDSHIIAVTIFSLFAFVIVLAS